MFLDVWKSFLDHPTEGLIKSQFASVYLSAISAWVIGSPEWVISSFSDFLHNAR